MGCNAWWLINITVAQLCLVCRLRTAQSLSCWNSRSLGIQGSNVAILLCLLIKMQQRRCILSITGLIHGRMSEKQLAEKVCHVSLLKQIKTPPCLQALLLNLLFTYLEGPHTHTCLLFLDFSSAFNTIQPHILADNYYLILTCALALLVGY